MGEVAERVRFALPCTAAHLCGFAKLGAASARRQYRQWMPAVVNARMSRSLVYGLALLRLFDAEHPVRGISEMAELMGVSRPTAHRYASTCLELGYLEQAPMRRYRLSRKAAQVGLSMVGSLPLTQRGGPVLRRLRETTGRTASLAVLDGDEVLYLQRLCGFERGQYELERGLGAGSRRPARSTAAGRALLSAGGHGVHMVEMHDLEGTAGARGLAVAVEIEGHMTSAIELTLPAGTIERASIEAITALSACLQAGAAALREAFAQRGAGSSGEAVVGLAR